MTDEGRGKGMETCFPWAARRPTFKWFVGDVLLNTSLLLFFLFFLQINGPTASWVVSSSSSYSQQHLGVSNFSLLLLKVAVENPQSKFISCYDITVELQ